jgi:hypothetical protein
MHFIDENLSRFNEMQFMAESIEEQLEYPRLEINDPYILHDPIQTCHEFQMGWVFLKAVATCQLSGRDITCIVTTWKTH